MRTYSCVKSDGRLTITGGDQGVVRLWTFDAKNPRRMREITRHSLVSPRPDSMSALDVSLDGSHVVVGTTEFESNVVIFDVIARRKRPGSIDSANLNANSSRLRSVVESKGNQQDRGGGGSIVDDEDLEDINSMAMMGGLGVGFGAASLYQ